MQPIGEITTWNVRESDEQVSCSVCSRCLSLSVKVRALPKTYTINSVSIEDTINLLAALGQIRSLLSVRMGREEEKLMIRGLGWGLYICRSDYICILLFNLRGFTPLLLSPSFFLISNSPYGNPMTIYDNLLKLYLCLNLNMSMCTYYCFLFWYLTQRQLNFCMYRYTVSLQDKGHQMTC